MQVNTTSITKILMGMPVSVKIVAQRAPRKVFDEVFDWFESVDTRYSPFKADSEVSLINNGLPEYAWSNEIKSIVERCEDTKKLTHGYFDAFFKGKFDPSGLVKGWAIKVAADKILASGYQHFYIDAGGDIQTHGLNPDARPWQIGIRNPFKSDETIKVLSVGHNEGVATSGAYIRGDHIYNPIKSVSPFPTFFASVTVIGPDIYEADRFATAVYAMEEAGAVFIESLASFEAYLVKQDGTAIMTGGLKKYIR